jgi:hypothetical protein
MDRVARVAVCRRAVPSGPLLLDDALIVVGQPCATTSVEEDQVDCGGTRVETASFDIASGSWSKLASRTGNWQSAKAPLGDVSLFSVGDAVVAVSLPERASIPHLGLVGVA